ncbi:MAG: Crp/Fnr family transcriptional regulator [Paramuribaculum sp.]|nr:Crp/Fnr family transcriptional regulator [Paramuribaculum sp.]
MVELSQIPVVSSWLRCNGGATDEVLAKLCGLLSPSIVPRRTVIVSEGKFTGEAYFIERGMTRSYWMVDGQEVTTSFSIEGSIVFSMDELYYGLPSEEYVETVEDSTLFAISLSDLASVVRSERSLNEWWIRIHQDEYRRLHRSHKERLTMSAADRYRAFARQFPEVCRRGRLTDIASYLGITLPTLSRIRAEK